MLLLRDEFEFLKQVARGGGRIDVPEDEVQQLIVQILVSFRLLWPESDHLQLTDRGRQFLVLGRRLKRGIVECEDVVEHRVG